MGFKQLLLQPQEGSKSSLGQNNRHLSGLCSRVEHALQKQFPQFQSSIGPEFSVPRYLLIRENIVAVSPTTGDSRPITWVGRDFGREVAAVPAAEGWPF